MTEHIVHLGQDLLFHLAELFNSFQQGASEKGKSYLSHKHEVNINKIPSIVVDESICDSQLFLDDTLSCREPTYSLHKHKQPTKHQFGHTPFCDSPLKDHQDKLVDMFSTPMVMDPMSLSILKGKSLRSDRNLSQHMDKSQQLNLGYLLNKADEREMSTTCFLDCSPVFYKPDAGFSRHQNVYHTTLTEKNVNNGIDSSIKTALTLDQTRNEYMYKTFQDEVATYEGSNYFSIVDPVEDFKRNGKVIDAKMNKFQTRKPEYDNFLKCSFENVSSTDMKILMDDLVQSNDSSFQHCRVMSGLTNKPEMKEHICIPHEKCHKDNRFDCGQDLVLSKYKKNKTGLGSLKSHSKCQRSKPIISSWHNENIAKRDGLVHSSGGKLREEKARHCCSIAKILAAHGKLPSITTDAFEDRTSFPMLSPPPGLVEDRTSFPMLSPPPGNRKPARQQSLHVSDKSIMTSPRVFIENYLAEHLVKLCLNPATLKVLMNMTDTGSQPENNVSSATFNSVDNGDRASSFSSDDKMDSVLNSSQNSPETAHLKNIPGNRGNYKSTENKLNRKGTFSNNGRYTERLVSPSSQTTTSEWSVELSYTIEDLKH
ncbi:hypothetical protein Bpfe_005364 [Biomphalaria pfeifferi]|uniref:Uncharacterized protein n=1 Tax=Biomphalaria pfeifferi TaxID=112525 RepID=A0AAD8C2Z6_BIOPF|nr:hypothetical protein Bpfe_005364 [Biomphalaria pfeifferi]